MRANEKYLGRNGLIVLLVSLLILRRIDPAVFATEARCHRVYLSGQGLQKDNVEGWAWWQLAMNQKSDEARKELSDLETRMEKASVEGAKLRARELMEQIASNPSATFSAKKKVR